MNDPRIEPLDGDTVFVGSQFSVRIEHLRHEDGEVVQREMIRRVHASAVVAYDHEHVWLVRQPREAIRSYTLEIPAGKIDAGETALQAAQRELGEEIGRQAGSWERIVSYHPSNGYTDEVVHIFAATDLRDSDMQAIPGERIEIVRWPLAELDGALAATSDAKTLLGLGWLRSRR